jgi:plasmid stabilization system protein ParE
MNNYNLIVKQEAAQEIINAYHWYESKSEGLGESFLSALDDCLETIDINPATYQKIYKEQRQAIVKTFPFVVMYEHDNNDIIVYAVFDTNQDPEKKIR